VTITVAQGDLRWRRSSIRKELSAKGGRYVATVEGIEAEAELVFTQRDPALVSADHTLAPESMRGTGAALALAQHMIADAREHGFTCRSAPA
jgi:predicted GNAT family acetyltransferase